MGAQTNSEALTELDEPALLLTVQTTVPVLTTLLFTLSLTILGFLFTVEKWPDYNILGTGIMTKDVALWMLSLAAFLFLLVVVACVKSHAWDYHTLSKERRSDEKLSSEEHYVAKCENHAWSWYKAAIVGFYIGTSCLMAGVAALFYPRSKLTFGLAITYIILPVMVRIWSWWVDDKYQQKVRNLQKKIRGAHYNNKEYSTVLVPASTSTTQDSKTK
jgi:hypothetical protein